MRRSIIWSVVAGMLLGIAGCGSSQVTGPIDPTIPAPVEPTAEGFDPNSPSR